MITPSPTANAQDVTAKYWIDWAGGDCPVSRDTIVDVRHADGKFTNAVRAGDAINDDPRYGFNWWAHTDTGVHVDGFITAYRVVQDVTALREALARLVHDVDDLMDNSAGVAGLHQNGDLAPWSELVDDGQFSPWLGEALAQAREALSTGEVA